jgi:hypothetical protein
MYDVAVELAPIELVLLVVAPGLVEPGVVRPVALVGDEVDGELLDPPLLGDALVSMNEVVPVALAPVRAVRDVPLVELVVDDVVAPLVPVTPA